MRALRCGWRLLRCLRRELWPAAQLDLRAGRSAAPRDRLVPSALPPLTSLASRSPSRPPLPQIAMAAHGLGTRGRPQVLPPLLEAMRELQLSAPHASALFSLLPSPPAPSEAPRSHGGGAGQARWCHYAYSGLSDLPGAQPAECKARAVGVDLAMPPRVVEAEASQAEASRAAASRAAASRAAPHEPPPDPPPGPPPSPSPELPLGVPPRPPPAPLPPRDRLIAAFATPIYSRALPPRRAAALNKALLAQLLQLERTSASAHHSNRGGWQSPPDLLSGASLSKPARQLRRAVLDAAVAMVTRLRADSPAASASAASSTSSAAAATPAPPPQLRVSVLNSWANINRAAHHNLFHDHPQAALSGVYYVADGGAPHGEAAAACGGWGGCGGNGSLEFVDPRYSLRTHRPPAGFEPPCADMAASERQLRAGYVFEYSRLLNVRPRAGTIVLFPAWLMHRVRRHAFPRPRVSVSFNLWLADEDGGLEGLDGAFDGFFEL